MRKFSIWLAVVMLLMAVVAFATTIGDDMTFESTVTFQGEVIPPTEIVTAANTLVASECGKIMYLNSATEFASTLPTVSTVTSGCAFTFVVKAAPSGASYTIITGNSLENVMQGTVYNGTGFDTQAAGDTITLVDGAAKIGDRVDLVSDGTYFYVRGNSGSNTGITISQAD